MLQILTHERLITTDRDILTGRVEVEVSHEALIREWGMLREWVQEDREWLRIHRSITEKAWEWDDLERHPEALLPRRLFEKIREEVEVHVDKLNRLEREFVMASKGRADEAQRRMDAQDLRIKAEQLKGTRDVNGAIAAIEGAAQKDPSLRIDVEAWSVDARRSIVTAFVKEGEEKAVVGDRVAAEAKFKQALEVEPPPDTAVYVWVKEGKVYHGVK